MVDGTLDRLRTALRRFDDAPINTPDEQDAADELADAVRALLREVDGIKASFGVPPATSGHMTDPLGPPNPAEGELPSDDPYCAAHGVRFDPAVGCPQCVDRTIPEPHRFVQGAGQEPGMGCEVCGMAKFQLWHLR